MSRNGVHDEAECSYTVFTADDGQSYLQIDTYGSPRRQFRAEKSQTMQFGPDALAQLRVLLDHENLQRKT